MFHLDAMSREAVHEIKYNGVKQVLDDMPLFVGAYQALMNLLQMRF